VEEGREVDVFAVELGERPGHQLRQREL
jgi:hypothetical protein